MKTLNNKGFSLTTMIVLIVVMLSILIFVTILAYKYGVDKHSHNRINEDDNTIEIMK